MTRFLTPILAPLNGLWQARSQREQVMLAIAGLLVAGVLLSALVIRPLNAWHDRSRDDYAAAMRLYRAVEADADLYRELQAAEPETRGASGSLRAIAGALAVRNDIALARLVPTDDGGMTVSIERAPTGAVMSWLIDLEERYGIRVVSGSMDRVEDGMVEASFVLRRAGGV